MTDRIHFIGLGGVGMAGLARLLVQAGHKVRGSDLNLNRLTENLESLGVEVLRGHKVSHVTPLPDWAVRTPAVAIDNPEVIALRERGIPVYRRGDILAAYSQDRRTVAVAGAHGKTTTSAMLAWILRQNDVDCGYAIGGETVLPGSVADAGSDPRFVCEADESDGSLTGYAPEIGILTYIEWDHPERFPTEESLWSCYRMFIRQCGVLWVHQADERAQELLEAHSCVRRVGDGPEADLQLLTHQDDSTGQWVQVKREQEVFEGRISLPGRHNSWNALMAIGAASEWGVEPKDGLRSLETFPSVGRRFDVKEVGGAWVLQDYAHHPTEIRACLESIQSLNPSRVRVIFEPHRYSRTRRLLQSFASCFSGVDQLDLLPVYPAFEQPSQGADSPELARACEQSLTCPVRVWTDRAALVAQLASEIQTGEVVAFLGAGTIGSLQGELIKLLS